MSFASRENVFDSLAKVELSRRLEVDQIPATRNIPAGGVDAFDSQFLLPSKLQPSFYQPSLQKQHFSGYPDALADVLDEPLEEPGLRACPSYYERSSSFTVTINEEMLKSRLVQQFHSIEADCEFVETSHKFRGVTRDNQGICHFRVNLFAGKQKGEILVEFQRRTGSRSAFASLYDSFSELTGRQRRTSGGETDKFPNSPLDSDAVISLLGMAKCELYEQQRDGYQALCSYATEQNNRSVMIATVGADVLVQLCAKGLDNCDDELCNYASRLMMNLSMESSMHEALAAFFLSTLTVTKLLSEPMKYLTADTKRCAASAVQQVAQTMSRKLKGSKIVSVLARHANSPDPRLQATATKTLELFQQK